MYMIEERTCLIDECDANILDVINIPKTLILRRLSCRPGV